MNAFSIWLLGIFLLGLAYGWLKQLVGEGLFFVGAVCYLLLLRLAAEKLGK